MTLYAWLGEDEMERMHDADSNVRVGIKSGLVTAGFVPLVAMDFHLDRLTNLIPQMEEQATKYGKKIYLCQLQVTGIVHSTKAGEPCERILA